MLSPQQRDDFDRHGLLRLPVAIPAGDVTIMSDRCWDFLAARHGVERDRVDTWPAGPARHLQALRRSGAFTPMESGPVRQALDDLLGAGGWQPPKAWGLPLVTFPDAGEVILMHPRTLHAPAPNALATPRMMLVEIVGRR
jgi:hypothetical protein